MAARSWRAVGPSSHRRGYQLARTRLIVCSRVYARELSGESRLVVNPRAVGGRSTFAEPAWSDSQSLSMRIHHVRSDF